MNKKRILILIASIIVLLSIIGVSFFFIKNKYNELEKLEINSSEKNNTKNNTSNTPVKLNVFIVFFFLSDFSSNFL